MESVANFIIFAIIATYNGLPQSFSTAGATFANMDKL